MRLALPVSGTALTGAGGGTRLPGFGAQGTPTPRRLRERTRKQQEGKQGKQQETLDWHIEKMNYRAVGEPIRAAHAAH